MIGLHFTTTSPSSSSSSLRTPWVLGCCGPMLMCSVLRTRGVSIAILASQLVAAAGAEDVTGDREIHRLATGRVVSPQRMAVPAVRHHDPRQIRVALELDPEQVVHLALVPVGAGKQAGDARRLVV